jgi:hypothetical protein
MISTSANPFPNDPDRHEIWEILMRRDFEAFIAADWSLTQADFLEEEFQGIDAGKLSNPDHWRLRFPSLSSYRDEWLAQAADYKRIELIGISKLEIFYQAVTLDAIEITGRRALAHKKFNGSSQTITSTPLQLSWQSVYFLRKPGSHWKITGFVGYLPNPMA